MRGGQIHLTRMGLKACSVRSIANLPTDFQYPSSGFTRGDGAKATGSTLLSTTHQSQIGIATEGSVSTVKVDLRLCLQGCWSSSSTPEGAVTTSWIAWYKNVSIDVEHKRSTASVGNLVSEELLLVVPVVLRVQSKGRATDESEKRQRREVTTPQGTGAERILFSFARCTVQAPGIIVRILTKKRFHLRCIDSWVVQILI